jgi:hypothetical protein
MSDLATAIAQEINNKVIRIKVLQSHPDGRVSAQGMGEYALKGTALIQLYEIALNKKSKPLIKATMDSFMEESPQSFPDKELIDSIITSVKVLEDSQNNNWENWKTGPYAESNGSSLREEYMPYVLLDIEVTDPSLLKGIKPGDRAYTALDFTAYKWM